jgi:hypothetical protein
MWRDEDYEPDMKELKTHGYFDWVVDSTTTPEKLQAEIEALRDVIAIYAASDDSDYLVGFELEVPERVVT